MKNDAVNDDDLPVKKISMIKTIQMFYAFKLLNNDNFSQYFP